MLRITCAVVMMAVPLAVWLAFRHRGGDGKSDALAEQPTEQAEPGRTGTVFPELSPQLETDASLLPLVDAVEAASAEELERFAVENLAGNWSTLMPTLANGMNIYSSLNGFGGFGREFGGNGGELSPSLTEVWQIVLAGWMGKDMAAAWRFVDSETKKGSGASSLLDLFAETRDFAFPEDTRRRALVLGEKVHPLALSHFFVAKEPEAVLDWVTKLPAGDGGRIRDWSLLRRLAIALPEETQRRVAAMPAGVPKRLAVHEVLAFLVEKPSPGEAWAFALSLPEEDRRFQTCQTLSYRLAPTDNAPHVAALPSGAMRSGLIAEIGVQWCRTDAEAAIRWVKDQGLSGEERVQALLRLASCGNPEGGTRHLQLDRL